MLKTNYATILKVAIPLMAGTFVQSLVMITDAAILSRYSTLSFDASGNAGLIYVSLFMGLTGLGDAGQIIIARRIGQKKNNSINGILQSSFALNLFVGLLFMMIVLFCIPAMLNSYSLNLELASEQIQFLNIRTLGFIAAAFMLSLNAYFMAIGKTWVIFLSMLVFAVTNILLDYLLVFGVGSIPAMGIKGAAWASVIAESIATLVLLLFLIRSSTFNAHLIFSTFAVKLTHIKNIVRVGAPLMIQGFFALATWTVFFTWIEQVGTYELTVSQNIRAVYFLAFVPIFGFGATTRTYISQYMDWNNPKIINRIIKRIILLNLGFILLFFHGALLYPEALISLINPSADYLSDSVEILQVIFGSILIFGISTPLFQTINGSGNTKATLIVELISIVIYLLTAYYFIKVWELTLLKIWTVEYIYFGTLLLASFIYLRFFNWRNKII